MFGKFFPHMKVIKFFETFSAGFSSPPLTGVLQVIGHDFIRHYLN
jgi:hypothetical protein